MQNVGDSLAGRAAVLSLEGLGLTEIQAAAPGVELPEIMLRGGFPELWSQPAINAGDFHRSYVSTYLERDLRSLQQVGNLLQFERFLRACALRSGQLLNRAELARDVGIASSTAGEWLSLLERSGLVFLLEPWSWSADGFGNAGKRLIRSPKLYWSDTGLLCWWSGAAAFLAGSQQGDRPAAGTGRSLLARRCQMERTSRIQRRASAASGGR